MNRVDSGPLLDAIDAYREDGGYGIPDVAVIVSRASNHAPQTVERAIYDAIRDGVIDKSMGSDIEKALALDLPAMEQSADRGPQIADLEKLEISLNGANSKADKANPDAGNGHKPLSVAEFPEIRCETPANARITSDDQTLDIEDLPPTPDLIFEYLHQHGGEFRDRSGKVTSRLSEILGVPRSSVTEALMTLGREGSIRRDVKGSKTFAITLIRKENGEPSFRRSAPVRHDEGTYADTELEGIRWIYSTLLGFDAKAQRRMLAYVCDRLGYAVSVQGTADAQEDDRG